MKRLLAGHPELREEAEAIAGEMLAKVSPLEIAEQVRTMMGWYGIDELNARAGDHGWGYVAPEEAADEILYDAIAGHADDMKRKASAGYLEAAVTVCEGIVAGLYEARVPKRGSVLEWSPDFPLEAATRVIGD